MLEALGRTETLERTIERLRNDFPAYSELILKIRDKQARLVPLKMNAAQRIVHEKMSRQLKETGRIRAVVLKARQEGVSTLTAGRFFRGIHLFPGRKAMVLADTLERAGALYGIYQRYLENLPEDLMPVTKSQSRQHWLAFSHDSELWVRPASDTEAGRALTLHYLHASELAFWGTQARETWISLMQAVPTTGSEIIVESTAKGAGGVFHELWEAAESGEAGWLPIFLPWWIHLEYEVDPDPVLVAQILADPDDFELQAMGEGIPYEGEQHKLGMRKLCWRRLKIVESFGGDPIHPSKDAVRGFQQEYPATAEEAFLVSGSCFFDEDELRRLTRQTADPDVRGRLVEREDGNVGIDPNMRGFVRLWEKPDENQHYVIAADTATGKLVSERPAVGSAAEAELGGRDYSAAVVLRLPYTADDKYFSPKVVAEIHGHAAPEVFAGQLVLLGRMYGCGEPGRQRRLNAVIGVERNHSSGQSVVNLLREHYHYTPLYWQKEINKRTKHVGRAPGWRTDETNRMIMMDALAQLIRKGDIDIPDKDLVRELVTFVVWPDGVPRAEENCHDDRVIATALAVMMMPEHRHVTSSMPVSFTPEDTQTGL